MNTLAHRLDLVLSMVEADIRTRYGRGLTVLVRWLADPLGFIGVYLVLVVFVLDRGGKAPGLSIACAVVPFQFVARTVTNALSSVRRRRGLLATTRVPREILPTVSALAEAAGFAASLVLMATLMAVYGVAPSAAALWFPLVALATLAVGASFAYPASLFGFWFPSLTPFAGQLMRALFFLASGLVALEEITGEANEVLRLNPLTGLFEGYRDALLYGETPAPWELLYPIGVALAVAAVFLPIYRREQRHFAKI